MAAKNDFRADLTIASGSRLCRELGMSEARFWGMAHTEKRFPCHFERQPKAGLFTVRNLDSVYFDREEFDGFLKLIGYTRIPPMTREDELARFGPAPRGCMKKGDL
jgi:hypothetical protein